MELYLEKNFILQTKSFIKYFKIKLFKKYNKKNLIKFKLISQQNRRISPKIKPSKILKATKFY